MPDPILIIGILIAGIALGFVITRFVIAGRTKRVADAASQTIKQAQDTADETIKNARRDAETLKREAVVEARDAVYKIKEEAEKQVSNRTVEVQQAEQRLRQREDSCDRRSDSLDQREHQLSSFQGQLEKRQNDLAAAESAVSARLEEVASMTTEQAREALIERVKSSVTKQAATIIRQSEIQARAEADKNAQKVLSLAIQRVAADHTSQHTVSSVAIPSDDLKGRIIGREGRNIRTFEQITGVNLIIDDTPEVVVLSCFDPVRREIGRITLENLIADGRIHPARIEDMFKKATDLVNQQIQEAGDQAAYDVGIHDLDPEVIHTLGRLRFRTSYGQNVLDHSMEVAYLSGVMASELGLNPIPAKRAGLLHDLGKAIDHEIEGSHAVIGAELARKYGEAPEICHAIEAHHGDVEMITILDVLTQSADAISAARPGARSETLESYIKRLEKLEEIANGHHGVERTYAMQAGREVRVMVIPEKISDSEATVLAHDIAQQIENEMQYPGQIKVMVIRESRAVDFAK
jgi:ribonucrease Y